LHGQQRPEVSVGGDEDTIFRGSPCEDVTVISSLHPIRPHMNRIVAGPFQLLGDYR
jgi:hypothetical protein